jgi:hypothetical protein
MGLVIDTSALIAAERAGTAWESAVVGIGDEAVVVPATSRRWCRGYR